MIMVPSGESNLTLEIASYGGNQITQNQQSKQ